ncbi:hypothetical protein DRQ15_04305 [candidate division KSB1 bacterium]|nr:MAG: hypothetical protein B5M50_02360 [candidate division KSB1 bacterium 4484_219]RKY77746.1 MAG: hypothetical protein DRQ12_07590 [candidate division KSB1 bacterium]HDI51730.1 lytic transglycosylase domain-containing protein [Bacteroidota bacterium]RKY78350.1 MAG: hypothetical protein DRQ00_05370 [candidate division KSB1 bacterium]RKY82513.1 MAG: hypothetical protein DRP98_08890 [candidate division KSB1 bacterium]
MLLVKYSRVLILTLLVACEQKTSPPPVTKVEEADTTESKKQTTSDELTQPEAILLTTNRISPYDYIVKKYARRYGFDWRLISAQIFAESGFRENRKSRAGALGLMQIMPSTAKYLGTSPDVLLRPEDNIALGCFYDYKLYNYWDSLKGRERLAFMFASYNAGQTRVRRAQRKAAIKHTWVGIKYYLPGETRHYVFKIFKKYEEYKQKVL